MMEGGATHDGASDANPAPPQCMQDDALYIKENINTISLSDIREMRITSVRRLMDLSALLVYHISPHFCVIVLREWSQMNRLRLLNGRRARTQKKNESLVCTSGRHPRRQGKVTSASHPTGTNTLQRATSFVQNVRDIRYSTPHAVRIPGHMFIYIFNPQYQRIKKKPFPCVILILKKDIMKTMPCFSLCIYMQLGYRQKRSAGFRLNRNERRHIRYCGRKNRSHAGLTSLWCRKNPVGFISARSYTR